MPELPTFQNGARTMSDWTRIESQSVQRRRIARQRVQRRRQQLMGWTVAVAAIGASVGVLLAMPSPEPQYCVPRAEVLGGGITCK
jgi:hypothetical protein